MNNCQYFYRIADEPICIEHAKEMEEHLPSLRPFAISKEQIAEGETLLFTLKIEESLQADANTTTVKDFDTGNGLTLVQVRQNGGQQFHIKNTDGKVCCLLQTSDDFSQCSCAVYGDSTMRYFGLNNALMLVFAFAASFRKTLMIHASCISFQGKGYPFLAKSGTGKSTHSALWMKHQEGVSLINDDNPIIKIINGQAWIYGSPWSGKTPCYRNVKYPLGALTLISRAPHNSIEKMNVLQALVMLIQSSSSMAWNKEIQDNLYNILSQIIKVTPVYKLHCLPNKEAMEVCKKGITRM